ncbi:MAG: hypothetical protein Rubg2KO_22650 [Rubricoccaceae bacterium]
MTSRLLLPALALLATPVAAQSTLQPGSDLLAEAPTQSAEYVVQMVTPSQQDIGTITTTESLVDDQLVMTSRVMIPMAGANQTDSTVVAWPSLTPLYGTQVEPDGKEELTFSNGRATGTEVEGDETREIDIEVTDADFGPGITRRLARSLPFEEGYVATFSTIQGDGDRSQTELTVTGSEILAYNGADRTVWIVKEVESGQQRFTYRVDAETREMLQMEFSPQAGVLIQITAQ